MSVQYLPFAVTARGLAAIIAATCFSYLILGAVRRRYFSPLAKYPGPFWASVTRWWLVHDVWGGKHQDTMIKLHEKYGDIVRTSPYEVQIATPDACAAIYGLAAKGFVKGPWYSVWSYSEVKDCFSETDVKVHGKRRRHTAHAYSMSSIIEMEGSITPAMRLFLERFQSRSKSGETVMLDEWFQWFAFDVIGELAIGKSFGFLEASRDIGWCALIEKTVGTLYWVGFVPYVQRILSNPLAEVLPSVKKHRAVQQEFNKFALGEIQQRFSNDEKTERKDMLSSWLSGHEKSPEEWTKNDIMMEGMSAIFAGSDTTAIALRAVWYYMMKNPRTYKALEVEVDRYAEEGRLSDGIFDFSTSKDMPYLSAVVQEAMRIFPSVAFPYQRWTPKEGATIAGNFFPGGVLVGCSAWVIHRNKTVFGQDANEFRPERWLESEECSKFMKRYMMQFGMGTRTCLGKNIALLEIHKLVPTLMLYFEITLTHPDREWTTVNHDFHSQTDIGVKLKQRRGFPWSQ